MIDITRELRNRIEEVYGGHGTVKEFPDDLCHRAADEIDRLRAKADALAEALRDVLNWGHAPSVSDLIDDLERRMDRAAAVLTAYDGEPVDG